MMYLSRARKPARILQQRRLRWPTPRAARRQAARQARVMQHPLLYIADCRLWLAWYAHAGRGQARLCDIPDAALDVLAENGFDWLWLQGVWQDSMMAMAAARPDAPKRQPVPEGDLAEAAFASESPAIASYRADDALGGAAALADLRERLACRRVRLMLDFVPAHTALDHPWVTLHPEFYVSGSESELQRAPQNYCRLDTADGARHILAHGRDASGMVRHDTVQLDHSQPALHAAQIAELDGVADHCDGVYCHGATLVLPSAFEETWGVAAKPFWPEAIAHVRRKQPDFLFVAEANGDLAGTLAEQGFDFCYDKRLYDRLRGQYARPVRDHISAESSLQTRLVRFLDTAVGPDAAEKFPRLVHRAAAVVTYFLPGMRAFQPNQLGGGDGDAADAPADPAMGTFYANVLAALRRPAFHFGVWFPLEPLPAWDGNRSCEGFIAGAWHGRDGTRFLVVVNYERNQGQCHLRLPFEDLAGHRYRLTDLLSPAVYDREGSAMLDPGLYIDLSAWGYHVFEISRL